MGNLAVEDGMEDLRQTPRNDLLEQFLLVELLMDEKPVSSTRIFDLQMRIGNVVVPCGGIGDVATERAQRHKGYARRVLNECLRIMTERPYLISYLHGIPDLYHKFGYAPALAESRITLLTRDAEQAEPRYTVRDMAPQDHPAVAEIHEALRSAYTGSIVRDSARWGGFHYGSNWNERLGGFVLEDGGRIVGYGGYDDEPSRCALFEIGYTDPSVWSTLLAQAARLAAARRVEQVVFHIDPRDPFEAYLRRFGSKTELGYARCGESMLRILDQGALLNRLYPLFAQRLSDAGQGDWSGGVVFRTDLGEDSLQFGTGGSRAVVEMPQGTLIQLLMGYRSVDDLLLDSEARIPADAVPLLRILCPPGTPYIAWSDRV
ncbi:MAG: GNAT family N-acetyltransferase [Anaerolineae bacterium]